MDAYRKHQGAPPGQNDDAPPVARQGVRGSQSEGIELHAQRSTARALCASEARWRSFAAARRRRRKLRRVRGWLETLL